MAQGVLVGHVYESAFLSYKFPMQLFMAQRFVVVPLRFLDVI